MARFASRRAPPCSAFKSDVAERLARWPLIPARARSHRPANKTASRGIAAPLPPVCHRHRSTRRTSVLSPPGRRRSSASKASYKAGQCPSDASESFPATFPATRTRPEAEPSLRLTPGTCTTSPAGSSPSPHRLPTMSGGLRKLSIIRQQEDGKSWPAIAIGVFVSFGGVLFGFVLARLRHAVPRHLPSDRVLSSVAMTREPLPASLL